MAPGAIGTTLGVGLLLAGMREPGAVLAFALCGFVAATIALEFARGVRVRRAHRGEGAPRALAGLVAGNRRRYGGYVVHLGVLLLFCGITGSSVFATQRIATLRPGEAAAVGEYRIRFDGLTQATGAGALSIGAHLRVFEGARDLGAFAARRNLYLTTQDSTTDVALRSTARDDLYVTLVGWTQDGRATIRMLVNPLVSWVWAGGLVLTAGAVLAMIPERRPASDDVPLPAAAWSPGRP